MTPLEKRKALLWVKANQPTAWQGISAPPSRHRLELMRRGLLRFSPERKRFDPVTYSLTDAGEKVLQP